MSSSSKKRYYQSYKENYSSIFSFIQKSRLGEKYAFCTCCRSDISIAHGGKNDIVLHAKTAKHKDNCKVVETNTSIKSAFFGNKDLSVINAECLYTSFLIEHNLPITCSDHASLLFRKMFPDSCIAKNYGCARTKTSAILHEMSMKEQNEVVASLKIHPFAIATDGSNDADSKLYPIVVTLYDPDCGFIKNCLLSVPSLEGDSTGLNIGNLLVSTLQSKDIPISNCIALSTDNAPVMIGCKSGVAAVLKKVNENIEVIGCSCHLINLAAEKSSACLPFKIDEVLVDIYYYLQKSSKRKERLKVLQQFHETDIKKVLKHVSTRWLSVGKCVERVIDQWKPLVSFFKEAMKKNELSSLSFYSIPTIKSSQNMPDGPSGNSEGSVTSQEICKEKPKCKKTLQNLKRKVDIIQHENAKKQNRLNSPISREERLFYFLTNNINKAFCLFLSYIVPVFEKTNVILQSATPHIHVLRSLLDLFKEMLVKFIKPSIMKSSETYLKVNYHELKNQKDDSDLLIGHTTSQFLSDLKPDDKSAFYSHVRKYYTTACDYMRNKFPYNSEVLLHAEIAQISKIENSSFSSLKFFADKFPVFLFLNDNERVDDAMNALQTEFSEFQIYEVPENIMKEDRIDVQWVKVAQIRNEVGQPKFKKLSQFMLSILTIPHSNAECERVFSNVRKIRTDFRSSMSNETLEKLLIPKFRQYKMLRNCI